MQIIMKKKIKFFVKKKKKKKEITSGYCMFSEESEVTWRRKPRIEYLVLVQKLNIEFLVKMCIKESRWNSYLNNLK